MGNRSVSIALFAGAVSAALVAFYFLKSGEQPNAPVDEAHPVPAESKTIATSASKPVAEHPREAPAEFRQEGLPTSITRALADVGKDKPQLPVALENEKAFAAEAVDPQWSAREEADINDAIAQVNAPELITLQVECRTSRCRLQLTQRVSGPIAQRVDVVMGFYGKVFDRLGVGATPVMLAIDGAGISTSLVYLPRH